MENGKTNIDSHKLCCAILTELDNPMAQRREACNMKRDNQLFTEKKRAK